MTCRTFALDHRVYRTQFFTGFRNLAQITKRSFGTHGPCQRTEVRCHEDMRPMP